MKTIYSRLKLYKPNDFLTFNSYSSFNNEIELSLKEEENYINKIEPMKEMVIQKSFDEKKSVEVKNLAEIILIKMESKPIELPRLSNPYKYKFNTVTKKTNLIFKLKTRVSIIDSKTPYIKFCNEVYNILNLFYSCDEISIKQKLILIERNENEVILIIKTNLIEKKIIFKFSKINSFLNLASINYYTNSQQIRQIVEINELNCKELLSTFDNMLSYIKKALLKQIKICI